MPVVVQVPAQEPGAIVTATVALPASLLAAGDTALAFTVTPSEGVRLFGAQAGRVTVTGGVASVGLTFGLSRTQTAGRLRLAVVTL
ncbi:MAG TPA: hypothetical protein VD948_12455, partial [Rhodothermales bacterium]|nr:hypothetical protein [Rhodothermales bacterium]